MEWKAEEAIVCILFLTVFCGYINYKLIKLPKSAGITLVALVISISIKLLSIPFPSINSFACSILSGLGFNKMFLHGMLSFLLFAAAIHINAKDLSTDRFIIASFATISVIISTFITGYAAFIITNFFGVNLTFYYCLVFGALISPTDAIAVLELLATTKLPKVLEMKISGESLFNDGMAIVLFFMALSFADGQQTAFNPLDTFLVFLREAGGGIVFGLVIGWVAAKLLNDMQDPELMITLTLFLVTGGYIAAYSILSVSGPLSMVVAGLVIGQNLRSNATTNNAVTQLENFWSLTNDTLNAILFLIIGIEIVWIDVTIPIAICGIILIVLTLISRWISVFVPEILLSNRKKFNITIVSVITWCGLRGGISIALALGLPPPYRNTIVALTYFVVLFSLLVQGLTLRPLAARINKNVAFE